MTGRLAGKVAFITGAARGQGRSHAVRFAEEGADIVAIDICEQIDTVATPLATRDDLDETVNLVEKAGGRIAAAVADVRDLAGLRDALAAGERQLGKGVDIVVANAGIFPVGGPGSDPDRVFRDVIDVNLIGVWNTISAAAPGMIERARGGSIVLTSSTQGLTGRGGDGHPGLTGYAASKHGVVGLMRATANWLAPHNIRVNTVHPTGVNTMMVVNEHVGEFVATHPAAVAAVTNALPVEMIDPVDVSNAMVFLASDESRYVTGVTLPVDAGMTVR